MSARVQSLGSPLPQHVEIPFSALNFSATGGGTWTVIEADVDTFTYIRFGDFIHVDASLNAGTIGGNPPELQIQLPTILVAGETNGSFMVIDPEGNPSGGFAIIDGGTSIIRLRPLVGNWTNGVTPLTIEISY